MPTQRGSHNQKSVFTTSMESGEGLLANLLILLILIYAAVLNRVDLDFYIYSVQEDEYLEWATFWAFLLSFVLAMVGAFRQRKRSGRLPWFLVAVGIFCFAFAMEAISWGQRVLGYRPPAYFLEQNFQQELNLHNLPSRGLRKLMLKVIILGYGVFLPVVGLIPALRRLFSRLSITPPSAWLAPSFVIAYAVYESYPWKYSGEIVELLLGMGFLLAVLPVARGQGRQRSVRRRFLPSAAMCLLVMALGVLNAAVSRFQKSVDPEIVATAKLELEALRQDFMTMSRQGRVRPTKCGLHKRVYSYVVKYRRDYLLKGAFSSLRLQGLPDERADFFIDPWNSPYWIKHECSGRTGRRLVGVYSFGPNRRRDSTDWEVLGDDLSAPIRYPGRVRGVVSRSRK